MTHSHASKRLALLLAVVLSVAALFASVSAFAATTPSPTPVPTPPVVTATPAPTATPVLSPAQLSVCRLYLNKRFQGANPYYKSSTLMVPLRAIVENSGWIYSHKSGMSTFGANGKVFTVTVGKNAYKYNSKTYQLDFAPELTDNRVYVPWQYLELALGMNVTIAADGRVDVASPKVNASLYSMTVNGKRVSSLPYMNGKTLMIPLRAVVEQLGYTYSYSNSLRRSLISAKGIDSEIKWDVNSYPVDNQWKALESKPTIKFGNVCVPVSFIKDGLKANVTVSNYVVKITR